MGGGGDRWGISLVAGRVFRGYLFSRGSGALRVGLCGAGSSGSGIISASSCAASMALAPPAAAGYVEGGWVMRNFSLSPSKSDPTGSFAIWAESGTVDIDSIFLEDTDNLFPNAAHARRDLAEATLPILYLGPRGA